MFLLTCLDPEPLLVLVCTPRDSPSPFPGEFSEIFVPVPREFFRNSPGNKRLFLINFHAKYPANQVKSTILKGYFQFFFLSFTTKIRNQLNYDTLGYIKFALYKTLNFAKKLEIFQVSSNNFGSLFSTY